MVSLLTIVVMIVAIFVIVKCADYIIKAISNFSREFGVTEYLLGFVIVAFGTSIPELSTSIFGSIKGQGNLVIGNLIGAAILDTTLVLGLMAIVGRNIVIKGKMFKTFDQALFVTLAIVILPLILSFDGMLSRFDGILLLVAYAIYLIILIEREETFKHHKHIVMKNIRKDIIVVLICFPLMLVAAWFLVNSAVSIANELAISPFIIGMSILAIGTTLPELLVEIRSVHKGRKSVGFGDVLGSLIANVSLILGISAIINPINVGLSSIMMSSLFLVTSTFVALLFLQKRSVTWKEGMALILIYVTFIMSEVIILR
ncbi:MAG: sodium:calcium antiporter [Nanoarchaeota archaeon]